MSKRRGLRVAVVALKAFAVAAGLFSLSGLVSVISLIAKKKMEFAAPFFSFFLLGAVAAAVLFLLSEAGVILIRLEEQGEVLHELLETISSGAMEESPEENE